MGGQKLGYKGGKGHCVKCMSFSSASGILLRVTGGYRFDKFFHNAPVGKIQRLHFIMSQEHQTTVCLVF